MACLAEHVEGERRVQGVAAADRPRTNRGRMTRLPQATPPRSPPPERRRSTRIAAHRAPPQGREPLVLAIDDHPTNLKLVASQLRLLGVAARTASGGEEGLRLWRSGEFDAIITDCHMRDLGGYALAAIIREFEHQGGHPRLPVIGWTADARPEVRAACHASGMDDVLVKPVTLEQLRAVLAGRLPLASRETAAASAAGGSSATAPFDLHALGALADESDVLAEFLAQTSHDLTALRRAVAGGDDTEAASVVHRIRGASLMIGASGLAHACSGYPGPGADDASRAHALTLIEDEARRIASSASAHAVNG